jgi:zinc/manganese transport system ATP-binding protein
MAVLAGLLREYQGQISVPPGQAVAYLPQAATLDRSVPVTVREVASLGLWARLGSFRAVDAPGQQVVNQALAAVGLGGLEQRLIGELSVGQVQRVLFARVLVQDAPIILLDEPFNAIDARTTADLLRLLLRWREERRTVVAVLHDLEQVRAHFDEALLLAREPIAWGPTAQVLCAENLFRARQMAEKWDEDAALCSRQA